MNFAINYDDIFVRIPTGQDLSALKTLVQKMGGMTVSIPMPRLKRGNDLDKVDQFSGIWDDAHYPDADEMCDFLRESRTNSTRDIASLLEA